MDFWAKDPLHAYQVWNFTCKMDIGCQIYGFGVLSPTEIDYMVWDKEGLGESRHFFPKKTFS